jgi:hypothetical protein
MLFSRAVAAPPVDDLDDWEELAPPSLSSDDEKETERQGPNNHLFPSNGARLSRTSTSPTQKTQQQPRQRSFAASLLAPRTPKNAVVHTSAGGADLEPAPAPAHNCPSGDGEEEEKMKANPTQACQDCCDDNPIHVNAWLALAEETLTAGSSRARADLANLMSESKKTINHFLAPPCSLGDDGDAGVRATKRGHRVKKDDSEDCMWDFTILDTLVEVCSTHEVGPLSCTSCESS